MSSADIVKTYMNRAEELRTIADGIKDPQIRTDLLNWAEDYERMAIRAVDSGMVKSAEPDKRPPPRLSPRQHRQSPARPDLTK